MASKDNVPQSGKGSDAARTAGASPLSLRRGNADPTDVDDSPLNLDFGPRGDYENTLKPTAPLSEGGKEAS
jgi:hypothetical protein